MKIKIGEKEFSVSIAETAEEHEVGLQNRTELKEDEGMLFVYDEEQDEISFWMKDTSIPLDIIFIDEDLEVISVHSGIPYSEEEITEKDVMYVLEVNSNSGIKEGDELELRTDIKLKPNKIYVLDSDGRPQMEMEGGERIFSRKNTKSLVSMARKAYESRSESDYKRLGNQLFKYLKIQDNNDPEYV